jgi:membrane protein implicated in regulation of membrane protease activity
MAQQRFSPRDEVYLSSTSFEVYMITGAVFLFFFSAAFLVSIKVGLAWGIWPGSFVAVVAAYATLRTLARREYRHKLRELEAEYPSAD